MKGTFPNRREIPHDVKIPKIDISYARTYVRMYLRIAFRSSNPDASVIIAHIDGRYRASVLQRATLL